jgi:peptide chain release factor 3
MRGVAVYERADGSLYALFESTYWLERIEREQPELTLERLVAEGAVG